MDTVLHHLTFLRSVAEGLPNGKDLVEKVEKKTTVKVEHILGALLVSLSSVALRLLLSRLCPFVFSTCCYAFGLPGQMTDAANWPLPSPVARSWRLTNP